MVVDAARTPFNKRVKFNTLKFYTTIIIMKCYQPFKGRLLFRIHVNHVVGQNSRLKQSWKLFNNAHSPTTGVSGDAPSITGLIRQACNYTYMKHSTIIKMLLNISPRLEVTIRQELDELKVQSQ